MLTLWTTRALFACAAALAVALGCGAGILHGPAAIWLGAIALTATRIPTSAGWPRAAWMFATALLGVLLGVHLLPGFSNPLAIDRTVLARDALPYSQYVNFDKTIAGVLFLGCSGWMPIPVRDVAPAVRRAMPLLLLTIAGAMGAALLLGFVRLDVRWLPLFLVWAPINLLTTCVSEEAFFRGLIQNETQRLSSRALDRRRGGAIAVAASAIAFGLAHAAGGWRYVLVSTIAGAGYAGVYHRTGRLEMAILSHFSLNAVHFLLFTYPALA